MELREYKVWDWPQRLFHWINALAVLALAAIGLVILNDDALGIPNDPGVIALKTAHVVPQLPKTRSGKILRNLLRKLVNNENVATPPTIEDAAVVPVIAGILASNPGRPESKSG